jgi:hypothetical protein
MRLARDTTGAAPSTRARRRLAGAAGPNRAGGTPSHVACGWGWPATAAGTGDEGDEDDGLADDAVARAIDGDVALDTGTDAGVAAGTEGDDVAAGDDTEEGAAAASTRPARADGANALSCACSPVSAVAVSAVGATTSARVLSGSVQVVRRSSRGMRRSSPASAPRRATAPGRGNGCQVIDAPASAPSSVRGGSDSARGIADSARPSSIGDEVLVARGAPGRDALTGADGSASRAMTASAAGRVAPT